MATAGAAIAIMALWPMHVLVQRLELEGGRAMRLKLSMRKLDSFAGVSQVLLNHRVEVVSVQSEKSKAGHHMDLALRLPSAGMSHRLLSELSRLPDVEVDTFSQAEDA